jgi:BirA family biotin operon repressor/biotin-[acetyl-CoA-carboxylase] ligase
MNDAFSNAAASLPDPFRLLVRETSASTNDDLRRLGDDGAEEGLVLLALRQTAGKGRRGAAWFSTPGESLAFSILLRPAEPKALWPRLALSAGLAVAEAVEAFGPAAGIKWPNDVWISGKKVAGILVEAGNDHVVVGIGLNVGAMEFPPEIAGIATSLKLETGIDHSAADVLAAVIRRFALHRGNIGVSFEETIAAVASRCVLTGHEVSFLTAAGPDSGTVEGIAPGGELLVRNRVGTRKLMQADEIRILA